MKSTDLIANYVYIADNNYIFKHTHNGFIRLRDSSVTKYFFRYYDHYNYELATVEQCAQLRESLLQNKFIPINYEIY